jgi:hypothetical protein
VGAGRDFAVGLEEGVDTEGEVVEVVDERDEVETSEEFNGDGREELEGFTGSIVWMISVTWSKYRGRTVTASE